MLGAPHAPPGGRAGSENDTLLPMTMTCDHPETLAAEEEKKKEKKILTKP